MKYGLTIEKDKGFTLVEAMLCILIISIGLVAISTMQYKSAKTSSTASHFIEANLQTGAAVDQLLSMDFDNPNLANGFVGTLPSSQEFTIQYTVTHVVPFNSGQRYLSIVLSTTWSDTMGNHQHWREISKHPVKI